MGKVLQYGALTTKIRAMRGKLITKTEYQKLAEANSVSEFVENLKKYENYKEVFEDIEPEAIHRGEMEKLLTYSIYKDYSKIYRFANMKQRNFLKLYFMKYEVSVIKRAIRGLNYEDSQSYFDKAEVIFTEYSDIDVSGVYNASSIEDIITALKGTIYYEPLMKASEYAGSSIFDYEMALDVFSFKYLWKKRRQFKGRELKSITEFVGTDIDLLNVLWIYRAKKYYKLKSAKIYELIIPVNFRLKNEQIKALVEAADDSEFMSVLEGTSFGKYFKEPLNSSDNLDKTYNQVIHKLSSKEFNLEPYSLACVNTYLSEKSKEILRLIKIAESIRYGYRSDVIIAEIM